MAPTLVQRYTCYYDRNGRLTGDCYYSAWDSWGRWVALVVIVLFCVFVALVFSCFNARRRRRAGLAPRYGTGWAAGKYNPNTNNANNQPQYYNQHAAPAPPYSPPVQNPQYTGQTYNSNEGYYGQQSGIELQQPHQAYAPPRGGDQVYEAPMGPPPPKVNKY